MRVEGATQHSAIKSFYRRSGLARRVLTLSPLHRSVYIYEGRDRQV